ncbi:MAG: hypothetical protein LBN02_05150 [Oscillospiraceae bacterium]|nr:hypothetical protein [Oscillospiraceae bacterium]
MSGIKNDIQIDITRQDDALIFTATSNYTHEINTARLAEQLQELAALIESDGGIVGHIKSAVSYGRTTSISVTGASSAAASLAFEECSVTVNAILFTADKHTTKIYDMLYSSLKELQ